MNGGFKLDPELAQQYINGLSTPKFTVSVPTSTPLPPGVAPDQGWATQLNAPAPTQAPQPSQADVMTALSSPGSVTAAPNYTHDQRAKQIEDADKAVASAAAAEATAKLADAQASFCPPPLASSRGSDRAIPSSIVVLV